MNEGTPISGRAHGAPSAVGMAAMVTVLHLALIAGRVSPRHPHLPNTLCIWQVQGVGSQRSSAAEADSPSNPVQSYSAGRLALTFGMAIVTLSRWLHVMRISGARTY